MSSRPMTPASGAYGPSSTHPDDSVSARPDFTGSRQASHVSHMSSGPAGTSGFDHSQGPPHEESALSEAAHGHDNEQPFESAPQESPTTPEINRSASRMSQTPSMTRSGTLKKKSSLKRPGSIVRSASKRSSYAGSVRSLKLGEGEKPEEPNNSAFYCPVPTSGNPTELLAARFQAWRQVLKNMINYFRDTSRSHDVRSKAMASATGVLSTASTPSNFLSHGGMGDALAIVREYHRLSTTEANKARDVENEIVLQLTGLRSDLQQKIKEIKSLSGDFKNSVDKEIEATKRSVRSYQDALGTVDQDAAATSGKGDPFIVKLGVDRQIEKQLEEENYLHRAYLNLENSGRELESIVVGEIQKAYNAYAGILRREADEAYETSEKLKEGPLSMSKDLEWNQFTINNTQMVNPRLPVRNVNMITYPSKDHPAAIEVKSGMLERKSKYLKNYTPGWYILSPTHLHEFKSADRIASQAPVMSLYLPEQKLGSHSDPGSNSHKFMLKGRQTGGMHRGHSWVFRAESYDTMMAWFGNIKELTEKTGEARNEFVRRQHARSMSGNSLKAGSIGGGSSNDGMEEDETDKVPFSSEQSVRGPSVSAEAGGAGALAGGGLAAGAIRDMEDNRSEAGWRPPQQRPSPGGRFPSDVNVARGLEAPHSPSSDEMAMDRDRETMMAAGALPGSGVPFSNTGERHTALQPPMSEEAGPSTYAQEAPMTPTKQPIGYQYGDFRHPPTGSSVPHMDGTSNYGEWMAPIAVGAGAGGAVLGAVGAEHHHDKMHDDQEAAYAASQRDQTPRPAPIARDPNRPIEAIDNINRQMDDSHAVPAHGTSSPPILVASSGPGTTTTTAVPLASAFDNEEEEDHERSLSRPRGITQSTQHTAATGLTTSTFASSGVDAGPGPASSVGADGASLSTVPTSVNGGSAVGLSVANDTAYEKHSAAAAVPFASGAAAMRNEHEPRMTMHTATTTNIAPTTSSGGFVEGHGDGMIRPVSAERPKAVSAKSVTTISELHVPGEFPALSERTI